MLIPLSSKSTEESVGLFFRKLETLFVVNKDAYLSLWIKVINIFLPRLSETLYVHIKTYTEYLSILISSNKKQNQEMIYLNFMQNEDHQGVFADRSQEQSFIVKSIRYIRGLCLNQTSKKKTTYLAKNLHFMRKNFLLICLIDDSSYIQS